MNLLMEVFTLVFFLVKVYYPFNVCILYTYSWRCLTLVYLLMEMSYSGILTHFLLSYTSSYKCLREAAKKGFFIGRPLRGWRGVRAGPLRKNKSKTIRKYTRVRQIHE